MPMPHLARYFVSPNGLQNKSLFDTVHIEECQWILRKKLPVYVITNPDTLSRIFNVLIL
jgi:hypothetical protein